MPALPPVSKVVRITLNGLIQGTKPWVNAFHIGYSLGSSVSAADVLAMATDVVSVWGSTLAPELSDTISLANVVATALDSPTAPEAVVASGTAGGQTTQPVAGGTAMVIQRKVSRRYRGGHSRVYLPGMIASILDDTEEAWDSVSLAQFASQWGAMEQSAGTAIFGTGHTDARAVNVSYFEGFTNVLYPSGRYHVRPTLRITPLVDPVVEFVGNPRPCSQRRRQQP